MILQNNLIWKMEIAILTRKYSCPFFAWGVIQSIWQHNLLVTFCQSHFVSHILLVTICQSQFIIHNLIMTICQSQFQSHFVSHMAYNHTIPYFTVPFFCKHHYFDSTNGFYNNNAFVRTRNELTDQSKRISCQLTLLRADSLNS